ncbi:MAG: GreA/GreB family elongation factor [Candidatus Dojkabacteria bacterium]|nr:MAG: GreA/GreB family elongation factor [Candidatus Dojkabacteria bacterium]
MKKKSLPLEPLYLTEEKIAEISQELAELENIALPEIRKRLAVAYEDGDIPENNPWLTANDDLQLAFKKRNTLRKLLQRAKLYRAKKTQTDSSLGKSFRIVFGNGNFSTVTLVSSEEAAPQEGKISEASPLGKCLKKVKKTGDFSFETPAGIQQITVLQIFKE